MGDTENSSRDRHSVLAGGLARALLVFAPFMLYAPSFADPSPLPIDLDGNAAEVVSFPAQTTAYDFTKLKTEKLGRGVIAWRSSSETVTIGWRYLSRDPRNIAFNIYRNGEKINTSPIRDVTYFVDQIAPGATPLRYSIEDIQTGEIHCAPFSMDSASPVGYIEIKLPEKPANGIAGNGEEYSYSPGECCVADVDGDGEFEILLKWNPSLQSTGMGGFTGQHIYECLKIDGSSLWRIMMGVNICAGEHYSNFTFADLDGDGKAEFATKTADGTVDGRGNAIGDPTADWRNENGQVLQGPEYFTVFDGETGEALATAPYYPERGTNLSEWRWGERGWGDDWGNRVDRFLFSPAFLDGEHLSVVACRGIYKRTALTAYDWDGKELSVRWRFDTTNTAISVSYQGQGFHSLRTGDVDGDGKDEIVYGAMAVDDDGSPLYTTGMGHGDAMHLLQIDPRTRGLHVFTCHESAPYGCALFDAKTGQITWRKTSGKDTGRAVAGDIDGANPGIEAWAANGLGLFDKDGNSLPFDYSKLCFSMLVWWTGTLERSFLPGTQVQKYTIASRSTETLSSFDGVTTINSTKAVPCLQGDILGDWREEVVLPTVDGTALRIYLSPFPTAYRFHTFLEDPVYRHSIANQHGCYNQPTHPGFYFGPDLLGHAIWFRGCFLE